MRVVYADSGDTVLNNNLIDSILALPGGGDDSISLENGAGSGGAILEIHGEDGIDTLAIRFGTEDVTDVLVSFELSGGLTPIEGQGTIARIQAGQTGTVAIPITGEVGSGQEQTLTVAVLPVPGETIVDNNESIYPVIFE